MKCLFCESSLKCLSSSHLMSSYHIYKCFNNYCMEVEYLYLDSKLELYEFKYNNYIFLFRFRFSNEDVKLFFLQNNKTLLSLDYHPNITPKNVSSTLSTILSFL